jgi:hypothetical protein
VIVVPERPTIGGASSKVRGIDARDGVGAKGGGAKGGGAKGGGAKGGGTNLCPKAIGVPRGNVPEPARCLGGNCGANCGGGADSGSSNLSILGKGSREYGPTPLPFEKKCL